MKPFQHLIFLFLFFPFSVFPQISTDQLKQAVTLFRQLRSSSVDSAFVLYQQVLNSHPGNKLAHAGLAEVYAEKARTATDATIMMTWADSAILLADQALKADKNLTQALYGKASALNRKGKQQEAAVLVRRLLQIDPDYPRAPRFYASLHRSFGNIYDYWYWSKKCVEQEKDNPSAWWEHALSYSYLLEDSISISLWNKMIETDPKRGTGWGELGYMELINGNTKGAVEYMRIAAATDTRDLQQLGLAYMLTADGQYKEAFVITKKVLDRNPTAVMYGSTPGQILKAFLFKKLNQPDSARNLAAEVLNRMLTNPSPVVIEIPSAQIAALYLILGEREKAMDLLKLDAKTGYMRFRYRSANPFYEDLRGYPPYDEMISYSRNRTLKEKRKWQKKSASVMAKKS